MQGSIIDGAWAAVLACLQPSGRGQINIAQQGFEEYCFLQACPAEFRLAEVCVKYPRPAEVSPAEVRPAEVLIAEVSCSKVYWDAAVPF